MASSKPIRPKKRSRPCPQQSWMPLLALGPPARVAELVRGPGGRVGVVRVVRDIPGIEWHLVRPATVLSAAAFLPELADAPPLVLLTHYAGACEEVSHLQPRQAQSRRERPRTVRAYFTVNQLSDGGMSPPPCCCMPRRYRYSPNTLDIAAGWRSGRPTGTAADTY